MDEKPVSRGSMGGTSNRAVPSAEEKPSGSDAGALPEATPGSTAPFRTVRADRSYQVPAREPRPADPGAAQAACRLEGRRAYRLAKRAFDAAFSVAVLVALSPLMALVALAVRLDGTGGPVLFRQVRVGKGGREFEMYKFRTMVPDAEERLGELKALNEKTGPAFKIAVFPPSTKPDAFRQNQTFPQVKSQDDGTGRNQALQIVLGGALGGAAQTHRGAPGVKTNMQVRAQKSAPSGAPGAHPDRTRQKNFGKAIDKREPLSMALDSAARDMGLASRFSLEGHEKAPARRAASA